MNVTEYTSIINNPDTINDVQSIILEKIVQQFPYFQSARALSLKGLYNQNSFKYNYALKITAAHTTDRSVLFDFITSDTFTTVQNKIFNDTDITVSEISKIEETEVVEETKKLEQRKNTPEESVLISIKNATPQLVVTKSNSIIEEENFTNKVEEQTEINSISVSEKLEIGKPIEFSDNEKHSFKEWLQLSRIQPIVREDQNLDKETPSEVNFEKQKKNKLIDKFIETSPKIPQIKHDTVIPSIFYEPSKADNSYLMTETLARVYLEQKKYQKAIQAYQILILKYPEKSSFFADRILDIKNLQQTNK